MSDAIKGLKPELVWKYFAEIATIPHGSKNETAIAKYVVGTAKKFGLDVKQDKVGNVVVRKPASRGMEQKQRICLQGHLDMVCEKNADKDHDFLKDPLDLVRKGNVIMANGTTLGADNGIAVATNLAIMEDQSLQHGPLEFLFTIDEETGLTGANNLQGGFVQSKTLLNLDSEEEGAIYVGCSGGKDTLGSWKISYDKVPAPMVAAELAVKGLRGGHSGLEIDKGRGNAIKIMNRVLIELSALGSKLSAINGGNKRNAIPRECTAFIYLPKKNLAEAKKIVAEYNSTVTAEFATVEKELTITITDRPRENKAKMLKKSLQNRIFLTIAGLPHGVIKMSADIPELVETSTNVAVITTTPKEILIATSQRSSVASEIVEISQSVKSVFDLGGAKVVQSDGYPGWKPNLDSPVLKTAKSTYRLLYGKDPHVKAIHAGLECGIIGEKYPGMDMISFGPTLEAVHSPDEKIYIDTVDKFWNFLLAILKNVN